MQVLNTVCHTVIAFVAIEGFGNCLPYTIVLSGNYLDRGTAETVAYISHRYHHCMAPLSVDNVNIQV